jgi:alpha-tubulin suppressor-like RCC1 family protein
VFARSALFGPRVAVGLVLLGGSLALGLASGASSGTKARAAEPASVIAISAGGNHTCALFAGGTIKCWGDNGSGQLGDGTIFGSSKPVAVRGITNAVQVSTGDFLTCALLSDTTVDCWGRSLRTPTPVAASSGDPSPLSGVKEVSAGGAHACALLTGGAVECWGDNGSGQLGDGGTASSETPVAVAGIKGAVQVSAADRYSCALLGDGTIECWGDNSESQLGDDVESHGQKVQGTSDFSPNPVQVSIITDAIQIAAGGDHACALLENGAVACWGMIVPRPELVPLSGSSKVVAIGSGAQHSCALYTDGRVACWKEAGISQLYSAVRGGDPTFTDFENVTALALGAFHTCVLVAGGSIGCFGLDSAGQLGNGKQGDRSPPVAVEGLSRVTQLSAAAHFSCARRSGGRIMCWGLNRSGQLGNGARLSSSAPVAVKRLRKAVFVGTADAVTFNRGHACAAVRGGALECWGAGPLPGGRTGSLVPVRIGGIRNVVALSGRLTKRGPEWCALLRSGRLECWRNFRHGRPLVTARLKNAVSVGVESGVVCAVLRNGKVECWGSGTCGMLGNCSKLRHPNKVYDIRTPVEVSGIRDAVSVSSSDAHSCAVLSSGRIKCWGRNIFGELSGGRKAGRTGPVLVKGIPKAVAVSAGGGDNGNFTCALLRSGKVECWGVNGDGELGDGIVHAENACGPYNFCDISRTPVEVRGISHAREISAGSTHACALLAGGTVKCWGYNENGELGDGGKLVYSMPVGVIGLS